VAKSPKLQPHQFRYEGTTISIEITYGMAIKHLQDLGVDMIGLLEDNETLTNILLRDTIMLKVWYFFVEQKTGEDYLVAIDHLDPQGMKEFRDAFWQATLNFSQPMMRPALEEMKHQVKKGLKEQAKNLSLEEPSKTTSSDSSEEQEDD